MIQLIRGFKDILPGEGELWEHIEKTAIALFETFGFKEIRSHQHRTLDDGIVADP